MARARNIKPGFFKNEILGTLDPFVALLFAGLWTLADKSGILEDRPLRIKAELFPYRDGFDINGYLTVLEQEGFLHRYEGAGTKLIQITKFREHQNPHHTEKDSIYPEYSIACELTVKQPLNNGSTPADSLNTDSLIPDSLNTDSLNPSTLIPEVVHGDNTAPPEKQNDTELQAACRETWKSYSNAYFDRYGTEPVRNAKVNGQVKQFVQRLGFTESPHVAAFFLTHNNAYYAGRMHSVDCLLSDAEKLRTEWATGNAITQTKARQLDKKQSNKDAVGEALAMLGGK
jgi:hypothetical protein